MSIDKRQLLKIAHNYFIDGCTQEQVARKFNVSRQKVNRLIKKMLEDGTVKIQINGYVDYHLDLEDKLEKKFKLKEAVVINAIEAEDNLFDKLGLAGAKYLEGVLENGITIGVAWGRTLHKVAIQLSSNPDKEVSIVQLVGGHNPDSGEIYTQSSEIARIMATKLGGIPYFMHAPVFVENKEIKQILISDASIKNSFDMIKKCNIAISSIGGVSKEVTPFKYDLLPQNYLEELKKLGCVGNICFRYFDINGKLVPASIDERVIAPSLQDLQSFPLVVGVAGGIEKYEAILGALRTDLLDVLITNHETALYVIDRA